MLGNEELRKIAHVLVEQLQKKRHRGLAPQGKRARQAAGSGAAAS
jgi:hypothetical protein